MQLLIFLSCISLSLSCFSSSRPKPTYEVSSSCKCGVSKTKGRIVGGQNAAKNEFPWQVLLTWSNGQLECGGSLLTSTTVLTAAHCRKYLVRYAVFGEHDISKNDGQFRISVEEKDWKSAPNYGSNFYADNHDDFAIITLKTQVTFSDDVYPICLPTGSSRSYENRDSIVTGWGAIFSSGPSSNILKKAKVRTITNSACIGSSTVYTWRNITRGMICAKEPGNDSCQGDSGGPLVIKKTGRSYYEQVGVVSWGLGCAEPDAPGVYARMTSRLTWIKQQMTGTACSTP